MNVFATKIVSRLRFHTRLPVSLTGGVPNDYQFRLNSLFDPDFTGTGHQPYGFDQLTAIYSRYRVYAVTFDISLIPDALDKSIETTIVANNTSSAIVTTDLASESSNCFGTQQYNVYSRSPRFRGRVDLPFLNGETRAQYTANENTSAAYNSNPSEVLNLHICSVAGSTQTLILSVTLDFTAEFFDQFQLAQS